MNTTTLAQDDLEGPVLAALGTCDGTWQQLTPVEQAEWRAWLGEIGADPEFTCCFEIFTAPPRVRLHEHDELLRIVKGSDNLTRRHVTIALLPHLPRLTA